MQDKYSNAVLIIMEDFNARIEEIQDIEGDDEFSKNNFINLDSYNCCLWTQIQLLMIIGRR